MVHAVEAPVDRQLAWDFWTAVDNWARVDDDIEAVRLDGDGGFRPGATGTTVTGSDVIHWTVAEVVEPRSAHIRFAAGDATLESRWTFEVVSPASCRVSQEVVLHGPGAQAVRDQVARGMGEGIPAGMSALVDAMVASSQTLPSNAR